MAFPRRVVLGPFCALLLAVGCSNAPTTASAPPPPDEPEPKSLDIDDPAREPDVVFWPTQPEVIDRMLDMADVKSTDVVYDLGSGDGRIIIAAAVKRGAKGVGYEFDAKLVAESNAKAKELGVSHLVTFERKDMFTVDLTPATVLCLYILPNMMKRLIPAINRMKPGSRIVSHDYSFPGVEAEKDDIVHLPGSGHLVSLWRSPVKVVASK